MNLFHVLPTLSSSQQSLGSKLGKFHKSPELERGRDALVAHSRIHSKSACVRRIKMDLTLSRENTWIAASVDTKSNEVIRLIVLQPRQKIGVHKAEHPFSKPVAKTR